MLGIELEGAVLTSLAAWEADSTAWDLEFKPGGSEISRKRLEKGPKAMKTHRFHMIFTQFHSISCDFMCFHMISHIKSHH